MLEPRVFKVISIPLDENQRIIEKIKSTLETNDEDLRHLEYATPHKQATSKHMVWPTKFPDVFFHVLTSDEEASYGTEISFITVNYRPEDLISMAKAAGSTTTDPVVMSRYPEIKFFAKTAKKSVTSFERLMRFISRS